MRVSLIHPRLSYLPSQQPMGLGYIASGLEKEGHEVHFAEAVFFETDAEVVAEAVAFGSRLVGISVMINYYTKALELARMLKEADPDVVVVMGGPHASAVPEAFVDSPHVDYVMVGEGEDAFPQLATVLERDGATFDRRAIPGLRWAGGQAAEPTAQRINDLDAVPWPARHLMPMDKYQHRGYVVSFGLHGSNFNIITSRGCPYGCTFCDATFFGRKVLFRSLDDVMAEIEDTALRYKIRNFDIMDDTFTVRKDRLLDFCERMIKSKLDLFWCCRIRASQVSREMIQMMARAGCVRFSMGIESADEKVLKDIKKMISIDQVKQVLKWAKEFGILTIGNFMIGNLQDDRDSIARTLQFSLETKEIDIPSWVILVPLPGTPVFETGRERGWIRSYDWNDYRMNIKDLPIMRNEALSHEDLQEIYSNVAAAVRPKISRAMEVQHMERKSRYDDGWYERVSRRPAPKSYLRAPLPIASSS